MLVVAVGLRGIIALAATRTGRCTVPYECEVVWGDAGAENPDARSRGSGGS